MKLSECWHILLLLAAAAVMAFLAAPLVAAVPAALFIFTLYFFRDPERKAPVWENIIICPADGRVLDIEDVVDPYVGAARRLSIFMSPFDVHVNRAPFDCKVGSIAHKPGKKVAAYLKGDLASREHNRLELEGKVRLAVEQYAGVVARRIVCWAKVGDSLMSGERFGMIKFGSRVDVVAPLNVKFIVSKDSRVVAGETVIARIEDGKDQQS